MYEEDRLLAEHCERLARETVAASEWLVHNKDMVGLALEGHEKALRKAGRLMRNCAVAARRKMCAGVFGPSQAGKSYLVSTLAGVYLPGESCLLHSVEAKFAKPVYIGDELTVTGTLQEKNETFREITIKAVITNQQGARVTRGLIKAGVEPPGEALPE
mgnify:CR=1 FL=1